MTLCRNRDRSRPAGPHPGRMPDRPIPSAALPPSRRPSPPRPPKGCQPAALVAVSKTFAADDIRPVLQAGRAGASMRTVRVPASASETEATAGYAKKARHCLALDAPMRGLDKDQTMGECLPDKPFSSWELRRAAGATATAVGPGSHAAELAARARRPDASSTATRWKTSPRRSIRP